MRAKYTRNVGPGGKSSRRTTPLSEVRKRVLANPEVRVHYDELRIQEEIGTALAQARKRAGLTQEQVAELARTTQSVIARLERGQGGVPSLQLLDRVARALGLALSIRLEQKAA